MPRSRKDLAKKQVDAIRGYDTLFADVAGVIEDARRASARAVNAFMTATYWLIGRRIVEVEQRGRARAGYGEALLVRLSTDLTARFGRGFSSDNLETMRMFYEAYPPERISETASRKSRRGTKSETLSRESELGSLALRFRQMTTHERLQRCFDELAEARSRLDQLVADSFELSTRIPQLVSSAEFSDWDRDNSALKAKIAGAQVEVMRLLDEYLALLDSQTP